MSESEHTDRFQEASETLHRKYCTNGSRHPGGVTKRAEAVMQYLITQGVKPDMITAQGRGEADPIASNKTAEGRAQNRRVELTLTGHTAP